jgi:hypothetical protein
MHYHFEIYFPQRPERLGKQVADAMHPFYENDEDGNFKPDGQARLWDWYQIGGRWRGAHDPQYDASKDATLEEECKHCRGTGRVEDAPCRLCGGKGHRQAWPTQWPTHPADVIGVEKLPDGFKANTLIVSAEKFFCDDEWDQDVKKALAGLGITTGWLVTVDAHS